LQSATHCGTAMTFDAIDAIMCSLKLGMKWVEVVERSEEEQERNSVGDFVADLDRLQKLLCQCREEMKMFEDDEGVQSAQSGLEMSVGYFHDAVSLAHGDLSLSFEDVLDSGNDVLDRGYRLFMVVSMRVAEANSYRFWNPCSCTPTQTEGSDATTEDCLTSEVERVPSLPDDSNAAMKRQCEEQLQKQDLKDEYGHHWVSPSPANEEMNDAWRENHAGQADKETNDESRPNSAPSYLDYKRFLSTSPPAGCPTLSGGLKKKKSRRESKPADYVPTIDSLNAFSRLNDSKGARKGRGACSRAVMFQKTKALQLSIEHGALADNGSPIAPTASIDDQWRRLFDEDDEDDNNMAAREREDREAIAQAEKLYRDGAKMLKDDEASPLQAFYCFIVAARLGHPDSFNKMGVCCQQGLGVPCSAQSAVDWFQLAGRCGVLDAYNNLGCMASEDEKPETAAGFFHRAAKGGNANAQCNMGHLYEHGLGVPADERKAVEWYRQAALQKHPKAMNAMGLACFRANELEDASSWFSSAADYDYPNAMVNLALCFEEGNGVNKSEKLAVWYYRKAIELGSDTAMTNLATLLLRRGQAAEAKRLCVKAVECGNADALYVLAEASARSDRASERREAVGKLLEAAEMGSNTAQKCIDSMLGDHSRTGYKAKVWNKQTKALRAAIRANPVTVGDR